MVGILLTLMIDGRAIVFRIHLFGNHVLPLLILRLGLGSWSDRHCCCGNVCTVYVLDRLVSRFLHSNIQN